MKLKIFTLCVLAIAIACNLPENDLISPEENNSVQPGTERVIFESLDAEGELHQVLEYERSVPQQSVDTRSASTTGKVLVIKLSTDDGASLFSAEDANALLQGPMQEFWQWHMPTIVDYSDVVLADVTVPATIPGTKYAVLDFVEQEVIWPTMDKNGLSSLNVRHTIVLLPPAEYGFEAGTTSKNIFINSKISKERFEFVLAHMLGHHYGLGHSQRRQFDKCTYGPWVELGGDDVMGGAFFRPLNAYQLNRLNVLNATDVNKLEEGQSQVIWVSPVDVDKSAISIAERFFVYYRKETNRANILDYSTRRTSQVISDAPTKLVTFNVKLEGSRRTTKTDLHIIACTDENVILAMDISTTGSFSLPLPTGQNVSVWVDAPHYLATVVESDQFQDSNTEILLKCGDTTGDGVVNDDDLKTPADFNSDGVIDRSDIALIRANLGMSQDEANCTPYVMNDIDYEVVFGQSAKTYLESGINPKELFPRATGSAEGDAIWVYLRKVAPVCN